jgi:hypothetical protein
MFVIFGGACDLAMARSSIAAKLASSPKTAVTASLGSRMEAQRSHNTTNNRRDSRERN